MSKIFTTLFLVSIVALAFWYWFSSKSDCEAKHGQLVRATIGFVCVDKAMGE